LALLEARTRQAGELHVLYLGNHGESQQLDLLIEAARIARSENPHITVRFVGEGTQKPNLQAINAQAGNPVEMLPASFGDQTLEHYRWADTCMVTLRSDWASFAHTVPSKTYELLSYGKHITGVVCGEAAAILHQAGEHALVENDANALAQTWLALAADPQSTPTQNTGRAWAVEHASGRTQIEKLDAVLTQNLKDHRTTGLLKRSIIAASISATAALEHLRDNPALFGLLVLRRMPQRLRGPLATAASRIGGGPFGTIGAVGKAVSGRTDELFEQAAALVGQRGMDRKIGNYARLFIALGDFKTAEWLLDRVRPNTKGLHVARAWIAWTRGNMSEAMELIKTAKREQKTIARWQSELES